MDSVKLEGKTQTLCLNSGIKKIAQHSQLPRSFSLTTMPLLFFWSNPKWVLSKGQGYLSLFSDGWQKKLTVLLAVTTKCRTNILCRKRRLADSAGPITWNEVTLLVELYTHTTKVLILSRRRRGSTRALKRMLKRLAPLLWQYYLKNGLSKV